MIEVEFNNANFILIKQAWNNWLNTGFNTGRATDFDDKMGKGVLFLLELEKGLTVVVNDNTVKDDVVYINKAYASDDNQLFTLNYLVRGEVYVVESKNGPEAQKHPMLNKVVLHHSKSNFSFLARKGKRAKVIDIIFSHEWLLKQFPFLKQHVITGQITKIEQLRSFYMAPISAKSFEFVIEIINKVFYDNWDYIFLKPRIISLIEEFIKNYIIPGSIENEKPVDAKLSFTMIEVKQKVNAMLYEKLPNIKTLAQEFSMSESTLTRRFKESFGKTIAEYYLDEKMDLAKRILMRDEYTISQIAYLLGYESASAFNKSFKKHSGISPGSVRKTTTS
jgi:AraC-like DNA-binding protein